MKADQLFSKEALQKLRSPEQLDQLLPITTPISWMALTAVLVLVLSVIMWSVFGAFTTKAEGIGLVMDAEGIAEVSHESPGKVAEIYVASGMKIKKGQLVARMEQPSQNVETRMAKQAKSWSQNDRDVLSKDAEYRAKVAHQKNSEFVYSSTDGIVDEILTEPGAVLPAGNPICSVRRTRDSEGEMTGLFYIPVEKGKRVERGMTIQLAPNGVDTSQSGWMVGVVSSVSQYPVSPVKMKAKLNNDSLVNWFSQTQNGSAMMEVKFYLVEDKEDASGYLWTSHVGVHKPVTVGSVCTGSIIVSRQPPIDKVFYKISQWFRNR